MKCHPLKFRIAVFAYTLLSLFFVPTSFVLADPYTAFGIVILYIYYIGLLVFIFFLFIVSPERYVDLPKVIIVFAIAILVLIVTVGIPICSFYEWAGSTNYNCTTDPYFREIRNVETTVLGILAKINFFGIVGLIYCVQVLGFFKDQYKRF